MTDDLTFSAPFDLTGTFLPYNYLPAALGSLTSEDEPPNRVVLVLPGDDDGRRASVDYHVVSSSTLKDPNELADFLNRRNIGDGMAYRRCVLGPPTQMKETAENEPLQLKFEPFEVAAEQPFTQVAVIIDIGIAFWNPVFQTGKVPRFKAMRYLDFDALTRGQPALESLRFDEIEGFCKAAGSAGGQDYVVAELGKRFPDSYFGKHGGAEPGTLWHGTAMADLMAGLPSNTPDTTALMGIELPMAVLRDADGDNLGAALVALLEGALEMTIAYKSLPLVIALPWGFTSGLQDGSHPFALAIDKVMALHSDRQIKLLLPMGNQMQDRCCAHILPSDPGEPENSVIWRVPPDDFSQNTTEIHVVSGAQNARQTVRITAPTRQTAVILLKQGQGVFIRRGTSTIGILIRFQDTTSGPRLRMVLKPTAWRASMPRPCLAGDWALSFHHSDDVRMWVLRDDRDWSLDQAWPRRASNLFDQDYRVKDAHGAFLLTDDPASTVVRMGTASVLATSRSVLAVQAEEVLGSGAPAAAFYSGRRTSGRPAELTAVVDNGWHGAGVLACANGTAQMVKVSGTSAAIALAARGYLGLPPRPT